MHTLVAVSCGFVLGLLLPGWLPPGLRVSLALLCLATGLLFAAGHRLSQHRLLGLLASPLLALAALGAGMSIGPPGRAPPVVAPAGLARFVARVEEVSHLEPGAGKSRVRVREGARLSDGAALPAGLRVTVLPAPLPEGALVQVLAKLSPQLPFRNPSPHGALPSERGSQAYAVLAGRDAVRVLEHAWPARLLWLCRRQLRARLDGTLPSDVAAVARALTLGDPDALPERDQAEVRASGLAHVFAVSGMHVTLLAGLSVLALAHVLCRAYPIVSRYDTGRLSAALGIPLAIAIGGFTGAAPSGMRAALTSALGWGLCALGRKPEPVAVTAFGCLSFAMFAPGEALRPAFLLSAAATAAIVSDAQVRARSLSELLREAARLSLRTTIATAPLVLWSFGALPVWGVFANLLLVPVGSLLLVLAVLHALVACACEPCAPLSALPLCVASRAFLRGCAWFAAIDPSLRWPPLTNAQGVLLALSSCALLFARGGRRRAGVVLACLGIAAAEWHVRRVERPIGQLRASFLDVGQGDAALLDFPDGRCALIDGGGNPQGGADPGARAVLPLLAARRRNALDLVVLSHPHPDHYLGLSAVLDSVPIAEVWDTGQAHAEAERSSTAAQAAAWLDRARAKGATIRGPPELCSKARGFGAATVDVLWPCPGFDAGRGPNDNSFVLRVRYGGHAFLFTGDIEADAEAELVASGLPLQAQVLKVPHHGSATSSGPALLRAVRPELAVISAGASNRFGHPNHAVVERLAGSGARVLQLSRNGGAIVASDGRSLRVSSWLE
ncbi:MAG TPA: DNA internalization-related competence protein ComEC/Rec2 [Polyangiales bacterium]|nr:DNA internalization-related competence protein ComEC/Rec2 [Polyangiales bacterium]